MLGLARYSIVAITIVAAAVYFLGSLQTEGPKPAIGSAPYWEGQTFLPAQWDERKRSQLFAPKLQQRELGHM